MKFIQGLILGIVSIITYQNWKILDDEKKEDLYNFEPEKEGLRTCPSCNYKTDEPICPRYNTQTEE